MWDVEGAGLQAIDDPTLAARLRRKVNDFNKKSVVLPAALTLLFVALPELADLLQ